MGYQDEMSDIKLSFVVEERSVNVKLNNKCFLTTILVLVLFFYYVIQFIYLVNDCDTVASVGKLTRFNNPDISHFPFLIWFLLFFLFLLFYTCLSSLIICHKAFVLDILEAFFDVESERNPLEDIHIK